jgi:secreted trypsin-like serine protease
MQAGRWRRVGALIALLAFVSACTSTEPEKPEEVATASQAITNGTDDTSDAFVVALMLKGDAVCSGTLITPYIVVTAGHCVTPAPDQVYFGSTPQIASSGTLVPVAETHVDPKFVPDTLANDIGIVALKAKAPTAPASANTVGSALSVNLPIRLVGFGATAFTDTYNPQKRTGASTISSLVDTSFKFGPNPSQTCNGDSGGAAFATIVGKEMLVGVTSAGDTECMVFGRDMRVDAYGDFIDQTVKAYVPPKEADPSDGCATSGARPDASLGLLPLVVGLALVILKRKARIFA